MGPSLFASSDPSGHAAPDRADPRRPEPHRAEMRPPEMRPDLQPETSPDPRPAPENDRALAAMLGLATLVGLALWTALLTALF